MDRNNDLITVRCEVYELWESISSFRPVIWLIVRLVVFLRNDYKIIKFHQFALMGYILLIDFLIPICKIKYLKIFLNSLHIRTKYYNEEIEKKHMKNDNANKWFSLRVAAVIIGVAALVTGSTAATMVFAASPQTLPACTDPTGQNLPCMMVISTLPPPVNAIQCQETSGQILPCSYAIQNLSNGQQVVVITIYAPANFVFSPGIVKVVVHKTEKTVINNIIRVVCPPFVFCPQYHTGDFLVGYNLGSQDGSVGVYDPVPACVGKTGAALEHCYTGYKDAYVTACHKSPFGCGDGPTICPPGEGPSDCHVSTGGPPPGITSIPTLKVGKGTGTTCTADNCTSGPPLTKVDCTKKYLVIRHVNKSEQHTAAYLQALNSGSPNPYKPGTKDYEHYQAGLVAKEQNSGAIAGVVTPGGTNGNNNNPPPTTKKCPDGSTIPAKDKCPPTSKQTNPSSLSGPSNPSGGGSLSPASGGSSIGTETGSSGGPGSSSSGSSSGGSSGNSRSSGSSRSSSGGSGGSSSSPDSGSR